MGDLRKLFDSMKLSLICSKWQDKGMTHKYQLISTIHKCHIFKCCKSSVIQGKKPLHIPYIIDTLLQCTHKTTRCLASPTKRIQAAARHCWPTIQNTSMVYQKVKFSLDADHHSQASLPPRHRAGCAVLCRG